MLTLLEVGCIQGSVRQVKFQLSTSTFKTKDPTTILCGYSTQQQCHKKVTIELNCQLLTSVIACPGKCNHRGPSSQDHLMVCSAAWLYAEQPAAGTQAVFTSATPAISALTHVPEPGLKYVLGHLQNH